MNDEFAVNVECCRERQRRLLEQIERLRVDGVIVAARAHVQWLTGCYFPPLFEPAAALTAEGTCLLVAPERKLPEEAAADEVLGYEAQWHSTLRNDQRAASSQVLREALESRGFRPRRLGVEFSAFPLHLHNAWDAELVDLDATLLYLRRRKEPDELALIRKAIAATGKMYARAREIVQPGVSELEVFNRLQAVAVEELGEPLTGTGNDYAANARGGPPRPREAQDGELYILDLGPAFRGYFADNCRTLAVNRRPTDGQQQAWQRIAEVFPLIHQRVRPGASCRALFWEVQELLDRHLPGGFSHHLGHGIGLFPHEAPHLNPHWDDTFELGDIFTVEPGLYSDDLRAGIRLENDYRVTESGVELLSDFPLEL